MDNSNFWDWDNEDEHRVSSVYRDTEDDAQDTETQSSEIQNVNTEQGNDNPPEIVTENNFILVDNPQNTAQTKTPQADTLYAQPKYQQAEYQQTTYQQTGDQRTEYQQAEYQQNNFQQMIPVQNVQQNQGTNRQTANQNKNTDYSSSFSQKDISENKVAAMAAYLLGPIGIIIALLIARDSAYTAFHVHQALKLTVSSVALEIIAAILALFGMIPLVGIIFKLVLVIVGIVWFGVLVLRLIAIAQVCDGEAREPAIIGKMTCFH